MRQKFVLRWAILCTSIAICALAGVLAYNNLFPGKVYAAADFNSISNGEWSTYIWSNATNTAQNCSCAPTCNIGVPSAIKHFVTVTSCPSFAVSGGTTMTISNGGQLKVTVTGKFTVSGGSTITVASGDSLIVNGNIELSGGSVITVNGFMNVTGNVKLSGNSSICGSGQGYYGGTLSGTGWCFTGTLPVSLVTFSAKCNNSSDVVLDWITATEVNNSYFTIERSHNGVSFDSIAQIPGAGNSSRLNHYSWIDKSPLKLNNYYRLRQTDYDGKSTVTSPVMIFVKPQVSPPKVYPNPVLAGDDIIVETANSNEYLRIVIYALNGKIIYDVKSQDALTRIHTEGFKRGSYIISVFDPKGSAVFSGKIMLK